MSTPTSGYPGSNDPWGGNPQQGSFPPPQQPYQQAPYQQTPYQQPGQYQQPYAQPGQYPPPNPYGQYPPGNYQGAPYGPPPYGQPQGSGRPGMVTAAAVLAFVWGGFGIFYGLVFGLIGSLFSTVSTSVCNDSRIDLDTAEACSSLGGLGTFILIATIATVVIAILMIWGGVVALSGKNAQILVIACAVYAALAIVLMIISSFAVVYLAGLVIPILIVVFLLNGQSKAWFKSKGGKTF